MGQHDTGRCGAGNQQSPVLTLGARVLSFPSPSLSFLLPHPSLLLSPSATSLASCHTWIPSLNLVSAVQRPVSPEEGGDNPFLHVCLSGFQTHGYVGALVYNSSLWGKDFPSGQWSKTLFVGGLQCVLGEAYADCKKNK